MLNSQKRRLLPAATTSGPSPNIDTGKALATPLSFALDGEMEDWRQFKEAGLLDKAAIEWRDREVLLKRASRLEKELYDYQHNMGLILREKEEWNSSYERIKQRLLEACEMLKRECSKNVNALSVAEERVESLRKALIAEKQLVRDLEREWRDLQDEHVSTKCASDDRLSDSKSLVNEIGKKVLDVEEKFCAAEARFLEVNTNSLELDTKLGELEARESSLKNERFYLQTEREEHAAMHFSQQQELNEIERILLRKEEMQSEFQKNFNDKAEAADRTDRYLNQKARDLDETQGNIDLLFCKLKKRESEVDNQLMDLILKEKNVDSKENILNGKQNELLALEENVNARGQVGVQKLLVERIVKLESKMQEFELELEEKRKRVEEEAKRKADSLKQVEARVYHCEGKLRLQEQALDKRSESIKEKERDVEDKLKYMNEIDNSIRVKLKELNIKRLQLVADQESVLVIGSENEKIRAAISGQRLQIAAYVEELKSINEERLEWNRMQSDMKRELVRCRCQEEVLLSEAEDLKEERENFGKKWEVIKVKRAQISRELEEVAGHRKYLENIKKAIDEGLEEEKQARDFIKRELEALEMEKRLFKARMGQEKAELSKNAKTEYEQIDKEFESYKENLKSSIIHRHEVMEKELQEREKACMEKKKDIKQITWLKQACQRELEAIQSEKTAMELKRVEVVKDVDMLDEQRTGTKDDTAELNHLRKRLQAQREQGLKDRNCFLAYVEKLKSCSNCGDVTRKFLFSDLLPSDVEKTKDFPLPRSMNLLGHRQSDADAHRGTSSMRSLDQVRIDSVSDEHMPWLHGCTSKILYTSPIEVADLDRPPTLAGKLSSSQLVSINGDDGGPSSVRNSLEAKEIGVPGDKRPALNEKDDHANDSQLLLAESFDRRGGEYSASLGEHSYVKSGPHIPDDSAQSEPKGLGKRGWRRKGGSGGIHTVKAVTEDANCENLEESEQTGSMQHSDIRNMSQESQHVERAASRVSGVAIDNEQEGGDSQGQPESIAANERRKRRQILSDDVSTPGKERYYLRRTKKSMS